MQQEAQDMLAEQLQAMIEQHQALRMAMVTKVQEAELTHEKTLSKVTTEMNSELVSLQQELEGLRLKNQKQETQAAASALATEKHMKLAEQEAETLRQWLEDTKAE